MHKRSTIIWVSVYEIWDIRNNKISWMQPHSRRDYRVTDKADMWCYTLRRSLWVKEERHSVCKCRSHESGDQLEEGLHRARRPRGRRAGSGHGLEVRICHHDMYCMRLSPQLLQERKLGSKNCLRQNFSDFFMNATCGVRPQKKKIWFGWHVELVTVSHMSSFLNMFHALRVVSM